MHVALHTPLMPFHGACGFSIPQIYHADVFRKHHTCAMFSGVGLIFVTLCSSVSQLHKA